MSSRRCDWAPLPLRLALGFGMMYHGWPKVFDAAQHEGFADSLVGMGVPLPEVTAWALSALELGGGLLVALGALTAVLSTLFVIEMVVAALLVHLPNGFAAGNVVGMSETGQPIFGMPGYEVNVLYIAGFLALLIAGAGRFSVDELLRRRPRTRVMSESAPRSPFAGRAPRWRERTRATDTHQPL